MALFVWARRALNRQKRRFPARAVIWAYVELAAGLVTGNVGGSIFSPPFTAIVADTIPPNQRGLCVMIQARPGCHYDPHRS